MLASKLKVTATTSNDSNNAGFFFEFIAYVNGVLYAVKETAQITGNKGQTKEFEVSLKQPVEIAELKSSGVFTFNVDMGGVPGPEVHWLPASIVVQGGSATGWERIAGIDSWNPSVWFGLPANPPSVINTYNLTP